MQCPKCVQPYQSENNIPRILVSCGHTLCEKCIFGGLSTKPGLNSQKLSIECPECGTKNEAESV